MMYYINLAILIFFGLIAVGALCIAVAVYIFFRIARRRAAKLPCPKCNLPIGTLAVKMAAKLQDERNDEYSRLLLADAPEGTANSIHFLSILPVVCPHCQHEHVFDLDAIGIGPV